MKKFPLIVLCGFVVTWTMKYAGYYCGDDVACVKALEGKKTQTFDTYLRAKQLICSLPQGAQEATINGIDVAEVCKPQPVCEPCKNGFLFNTIPATGVGTLN